MIKMKVKKDHGWIDSRENITAKKREKKKEDPTIRKDAVLSDQFLYSFF